MGVQERMQRHRGQQVSFEQAKDFSGHAGSNRDFERQLAGIGSVLGMSQQQSPIHALEQYKHNSGWVHACFTAGALVGTSEGVERIEDIQKGDLVRDHDGLLCAVAETGNREYDGVLATIVASGILPIQATQEHPFHVRRTNGQQEWVLAKDLVVGDALLMPRRIPERASLNEYTVTVENDGCSQNDPKRSYQRTIAVNDDLFRLIGYYLAEGFIAERQSGSGNIFPSGVRFTFASGETSYIDFVQESMQKIFGCRHALEVPEHGGTATTLQFSSRLAAEFFLQFKKGAKNKIIPRWIQIQGESCARALLKSYWEGDGSYGGRCFKLTTASASLADGVQRMLLRLGLFAGINSLKPGEYNFQGKCINRSRHYILSIAGESFEKAQDLFGFRVERVNSRFYPSRVQLDEQFAYLPVKRVLRENVSKVRVFNLEVEGSHTYQVNGVGVHNSIQVKAHRIAAQPLKLARRVVGNPMAMGIKGMGETTAGKAYIDQKVPLHLKAAAPNFALLEKHPLLDAMLDPNPIMVSWSLMCATVFNLDLTGRCVWLTFWDEKEEKMSIWPVPIHWCEPRHNKGLFSSWLIRPEGSFSRMEVPGHQVIYFNMTDPAHPLASLGTLQAQARAVLADEAVQESQRRAFLNGIWPGLAVMIGNLPDEDGEPNGPPISLNEKQRDDILDAIKRRYRGVYRTDEPIICDGFIRDVKEVTRSNREMAYKDSAVLTKSRVVQGFKVNPISMGEIEGANRACHDTATELLTRRGWLRYDEISEDDEVGTVNKESNSFEWQRIEATHIYDYNGEMVRLVGQKIDAMMTPEHRMWTTRHSQQLKDGNRPLNKNQPWSFKPAGGLVCHDALLLTPKQAEANHVPWFTIPGVEFSRFGRREHSDDLVVPMNPFLAFLGWWVSEGWTTGTKRSGSGHGNYSIGIKQAINAKPECDAISDNFGSLGGISVSTKIRPAQSSFATKDGYARQSTKTWIASDKRLWTWLRQHCGTSSANKRLPDFVFDLSGHQLSLLLDALLLGDGSHRKAVAGKKYSGKTATYFTTSKELADQVQILATLCGRAARACKQMKQGIYPVTVTTYCTRMSLLPKHITREQYTGKVWCVTVPNGIVITRRNGKQVVSGNSAVVADENLCANAINPTLVMIGQTITAWLTPMYRGTDENLIAFFEECRPNNPEFELDLYQKGLQGGTVRINEWRAKFGMPRLIGGDAIWFGGMSVPCRAEGEPERNEPPLIQPVVLEDDPDEEDEDEVDDEVEDNEEVEDDEEEKEEQDEGKPKKKKPKEDEEEPSKSSKEFSVAAILGKELTKKFWSKAHGKEEQRFFE